MSDSFCDSPLDCPDFQKQGKIPEGGKGKYNEGYVPAINEYHRTPSPNGVREKFYEEEIPKPSGESDMF